MNRLRMAVLQNHPVFEGMKVELVRRVSVVPAARRKRKGETWGARQA